MAKVTVQDFLESIDTWTVLELAEAVKALEQKYGISTAMPTAWAPAQVGGPAAQTGPAVEEKTEFTVVLTGVPAEKKIPIIKEVRAITGLGLKEAKDLVEGAPKAVKEGLSKQEAQEIKTKLEAVGATVELK